MTVTRLSADAARRTALAAQGFTRPRPSGRVTRRHLRRVFDDIGLIQIDSVNVLVRSQELPLFARLGAAPPHVDPRRRRRRRAVRVLGARRLDRADDNTSRCCAGGWRRWSHGRYARHFTQRRPGMLDKVLDQVRARGPIAVGDVEGRVRNPGTWWNWDDAKLALEILFDQGVVSVTRRPSDFARLLRPHRAHRPRGGPRRSADRRSTRPGGSCCCSPPARSASPRSADLCDYYRLNATTCKPIVDELVADGSLVAGRGRRLERSRRSSIRTPSRRAASPAGRC